MFQPFTWNNIISPKVDTRWQQWGLCSFERIRVLGMRPDCALRVHWACTMREKTVRESESERGRECVLELETERENRVHTRGPFFPPVIPSASRLCCGICSACFKYHRISLPDSLTVSLTVSFSLTDWCLHQRQCIVLRDSLSAHTRPATNC